MNEAQQDTIQLEQSWKALLLEEFSQPYMQDLKKFLYAEKSLGKAIYPTGKQIFNALNSTPLDQVRVVILGQDPYHNPGQAHGLCFSVQPGVAIPPSLKNIYQELQTDLGLLIPTHGYLQSWADQGVLLLNSVLTVEAYKAASHQGRGWETFTDQIIKHLNQQREHLVFLLWGSYAERKGAMIDRSKHCILTAPHPSPLSAYRGFLGCRHFSQANAYLSKHQQPPIDWSLPQSVHHV